jgi:hypothetical protein
MVTMMLRGGLSAALVCLLLAVPSAQGQGQDPVPAPERLPAGEVLRLFDAYAVVQAQEALGLDNAQYGTFVSGYKTLLETRRRHREQRTKMVAELARLVGGGASPSEEAVRSRLRMLKEQDARTVTDTADALEAVEQSLTVLQRARFYVFEERIERRKLELLSRARMQRQNRRGLQP